MKNTYTKMAMKLFLQSILILLHLPSLFFCLQTDTITSTLSITDPDTIISRRQVYKLGFFSPQNSTNRYLGIFYTASETTVIWVANRDNPLKDSTGTLTISRDGNLVLINGRNQTIWSTNATSSANTTAQIHDNGNLVLRDGPTGTTIWDSFSIPTDVFVPTMHLIDNLNTNRKVYLSAWRNGSDPGSGNFTAGLEAMNIPQIVIWKNGGLHWRSGPWNGQILIGIQDMYSPYLDGFTVLDNPPGNFYFTAPEGNVLMKVALNSSGKLIQSLWDEQKQSWDIIWVAPRDECEVYGACGPFASCNARRSPICSCVRGFEPVSREEWGSMNWSSGCQRRRELRCGNGDGFLRLQFMKVPEFAERFPSRRAEECVDRCLSNCSCVAYAFDSNIGCMFWSGSLIDLQRFNGVGADVYIRLHASELDRHQDKKLIIIIPVIVGFVLISILAFIAWCWMVKTKRQTFSPDLTAIILKHETNKVNIEELPLFTFETLANATDQFNDENLLGKGGFGPVYKGHIGHGIEIAVKRLSSASGQGTEEFMNEVVVISKLQHKNLVRLLGCCVEKDEKMLIYEYMPNKSLDVCLFDTTHASQNHLDWRKRFSIIEGIARGILYLHRDSRLRIIHRDLKPSNVLLDEDWNPKISDFGMARIFGGNEDHANTARVVGTYGYMAPEYAMEGRISEKSDVYSFGVLMLEIVKGQKNSYYYNHEWSLSLLGCAWKLWSEDNGVAFADESLRSLDFQGEIVRCIHIGLLCVQEFPEDRPAIQTVLSMLSCEIVDLPMPEQPVFAEKWNGLDVGSTQPIGHGCSSNELTLTVLDGR